MCSTPSVVDRSRPMCVRFASAWMCCVVGQWNWSARVAQNRMCIITATLAAGAPSKWSGHKNYRWHFVLSFSFGMWRSSGAKTNSQHLRHYECVIASHACPTIKKVYELFMRQGYDKLSCFLFHCARVSSNWSEWVCVLLLLWGGQLSWQHFRDTLGVFFSQLLPTRTSYLLELCDVVWASAASFCSHQVRVLQMLGWDVSF